MNRRLKGKSSVMYGLFDAEVKGDDPSLGHGRTARESGKSTKYITINITQSLVLEQTITVTQITRNAYRAGGG